MNVGREGPLCIQAVITGMGCGGAERQMALLSEGLAARGHQVSLAALHGTTSFFALHPDVEVRFFESEHKPWGGRFGRFVARSRWLRRVIEERCADAVVSFIEVANVQALLAARPLSVPVLVAERTHPPSHRVRRLEGWLRLRLYPRAAAVVVQTEATGRWVRECHLARRIEVIPNLVPIPAPLGAQGVELPKGPCIVSMGRLEPVKRFDLLIDGFASICGRHPEWSVMILGEGPERTRLSRQIERLGLAGRVSLPGAVSHPASVLAACDLFVLTSDYEGFPNALCEAMALGLPVVSTDCPVGPREVVRHEVDGLLISPGDPVALAAALDWLMSDVAERTRLGRAAADVTRRFSVAGALDRWESLLRELVKGPGP